MKPNELRIGNIVKHRDTGKIVRVCGLLPKSVQYCKDLDGEPDYRFCRYVDIEGVLIHDHWQKIDCPTLWLHDNTGTYYYGGFTLHKGVRYIHELQNLHFALTSKELEIEL